MKNLKSLLLVAAVAAVASTSGSPSIGASGVDQQVKTMMPVASHSAPMADLTPASGPRDLRGESVREITLPAGTLVSLQLGTTVSSRVNNVEDPVQATVRRPIVIDGMTVVPAGTPVSGYVSQAVRPGRVKGRARIGVRFTTLRLDGTRYNMRTNSITRIAPATKSEDATKIAIGAGTGAVIGAIAGGKKGAAIGTAVGGGGGTGVVLATQGHDVALGRGAAVTTRLTAPLVIRLR